jgi:hypothetical protein
MRHQYLLSIHGLGFALGFCGAAFAAEKPDVERAPGLTATFTNLPESDFPSRQASYAVMLPELGLAADESPHPMIHPSFSVNYEGFLMVELPGRYQFESPFEISLDGKLVTDEVQLDAGSHALRLAYDRAKGAVSAGFSWQSEHFIKEPVPPTALWHEQTLVIDGNLIGPHSSPPNRIKETMKSMKCASCHDAGFLATMHHKFAPDAILTHMRHANPMKWYGAMTGPLFEESEELTQLADDLRKLPRPERQRGKLAADTGEGLKMIGTQGGFACIACHDIKHHRTAAESKGPNLSFITQRVSYDWFVRWMSNPQRMKPGVPMPAFFMAQSPEQQKQSIDALWDYLAQGDEMELPAELIVNPQQFVLKPTTKPMVHRVYVRLSNGRELLRTICVGLPNGMSYCFDAETCRLAYIWTGGYLDMTPHWKNQSLHPIPMLGDAFYLPSEQEGLQIGDHAAVFRGYELVGGVPRFEFSFGDTAVRLMIDASSPDELRQTFTIGEGAGPVQFVGPSADADVSMTASSGKWAGNRLTLTDTGEVELTLNVKKVK